VLVAAAVAAVPQPSEHSVSFAFAADSSDSVELGLHREQQHFAFAALP
jgi:hypothetical protein